MEIAFPRTPQTLWVLALPSLNILLRYCNGSLIMFCLLCLPLAKKYGTQFSWKFNVPPPLEADFWNVGQNVGQNINVNDFATSLLNICVSANQNLYSPRETTKIYIFVNIVNRLINHIFYITPYYNYEKRNHKINLNYITSPSCTFDFTISVLSAYGHSIMKLGGGGGGGGGGGSLLLEAEVWGRLYEGWIALSRDFSNLSKIVRWLV
jgi:hypothetical protein